MVILIVTALYKLDVFYNGEVYMVESKYSGIIVSVVQ
jgi:hypothetical protein